jgi:hypothetical protein
MEDVCVETFCLIASKVVLVCRFGVAVAVNRITVSVGRIGTSSRLIVPFIQPSERDGLS